MKKILILAAAFALLPGAVIAAELTLDEVTAKMEEADKNVTSLEFAFTQEISYNLTKEKQTSGGNVSFMKPSSLYVKTNRPLEQEIISDGKKVWIYTPKYRQVIVDNWKKWTANSFVPVSIINFGKGWKDLRKRFRC